MALRYLVMFAAALYVAVILQNVSEPETARRKSCKRYVCAEPPDDVATLMPLYPVALLENRAVNSKSHKPGVRSKLMMFCHEVPLVIVCVGESVRTAS